MRRSPAPALAALALVMGVAAPVGAEIELVEEGPFVWTLGGYARLLAGAQAPRIEVDLPQSSCDVTPELCDVPPAVGLASAVLRFEWAFKVSDIFKLDVHNRLLLSGSSSSTATSGGLGVGVSVSPGRSVDTSTEIFSHEGFRLEHDLDRLVAHLFIDQVDLSIGRQAITWGISNLFTVADVWAAFSPFDLDTSQKRGIDAIRAVVNLGSAELDVILADRGPPGADNLSGGVRAVFYTDVADVHVAAGKFWMDVALTAGIVAPVDPVKLRLEAMAAYALDEDRFRLPRITLGVDWYAAAELVVMLELHYNGLGTEDASGYYAQYTHSDTVARGQNYLVGRYYAGLAVAWRAHELINLNLTAMMNLGDPSGLIAWGFGYAVAQDVELALGGFHGIGPGVLIGDPAGVLDADPALLSEMGTYGHMVYLEMAAFF